MERPLVIESEEACALASELAELTRSSVSEAVIAAVREKLQRQREIEARIAQANRIVDEMQKHWVARGSSEDLDDLYGEDGLPT
ncbi:MAG: type II toxin-antitoxin system VapB family antitoxin [Acetobacteraceae bacterium]|nr:type II toxin-antitoxin system VapB family antitoxin [Acetobacteraceae bacterium]